MAQINISIRIDEEVKKEAEALFAKLGLTISAATNIFFRQAVRTQGIPFPITVVEQNIDKQARNELKTVFQAMQKQSIINGTDNITLEEINAIIDECRKEASIAE